MKLPPEPDGRRRDGVSFAVHFALGGTLGLLVGWKLGHAVWPDCPWASGLCSGGGALAVGALAGFFGDRVWGLIIWLVLRS